MTSLRRPAASKAVLLRRQLICIIVGLAGYAALSALVLSAYVLMQGGAFLVPMSWPTPGFISMIAAPVLLAAFLPFVAVHLIATVLRLRVSPLAATLAGAAMGALGAYAFCGRQQCFHPGGTLPLLGWYIVALTALAALLHHLHAKTRGF